MYNSTLSLTPALDGVDGEPHAPGRFIPGKETQYPLYRRLGGPRGRSGRVRKNLLPPVFDPRTVQPIASLYNVYAIPAHILYLASRNFKCKVLGLRPVSYRDSSPPGVSVPVSGMYPHKAHWLLN